MIEYNIRDCVDEDARDIWQINRDVFGYIYDADQTAMRLHEILRNPYYKVLVADYGGNTVGYIQGSGYDNTYDDHLKNIMALGVKESHQSMGVGRSLITAFENWAKEDGAAGVRLVSGYNRTGAHGFYLACGYINRKDQKNFMKRLK